jgi:dihydrodiol dehydrogenase / D-xylose 1-dehydrogenase (NADP)
VKKLFKNSRTPYNKVIPIICPASLRRASGGIMEKQYGWGILGLGSIANRFMSGLCLSPRARLAAVASRSPEKSRAFADRHGADKALTSYEALMNDPSVDIVYVATPHPFHLEQAAAALRAGKHVLVEKPACVSSGDFAALSRLAKEKNRFLMEGMWTRFFPVNEKVTQWLAQGRIGRLRQVQAALSSPSTPGDGQSRIYRPDLAGGALLDVGVYPIAYADLCYAQAPDRIAALAEWTGTGVDGLSNYLLHYPCGGSALLSGGINCYQKDTAWLWGEQGHIEVPDFWHPGRAVLTFGEQQECYESPIENEGFQYEIEHVHQCLDQGLLQSPVMDHASSLRVLSICDEIRRQLPLRFPFETEQ